MARIVKDRIKQTSTTTGTGAVTLSASVAGYQDFSVIGNNSTTFYCIEDANGTAFEVGIGSYNNNVLTRTTILDSSNSGNAISLTTGTHDVFVTYPAGRAGFNDEGLSPTLTASGTVTAGKPVIQNTNGTVTQVAESAAPPISPGLGSIATELGYASYNSTAFGKNSQRVTAYRGATIGSGNYNITLRVATVSTTDLKTVTWSGESTIVQSTPAGLSGIGIIYHEDADKYIVAWRGDSGYLYGCTLTVSGTGATATVSAGTQVALTSNNISGFKSNNMCYDTVNDFAILIYVDSTPKTRSLDISSTNLTAGTVATISTKSTSTYKTPVCAWNKYHGVVVYAYRDSSEDLYYNLATPNSNGTIPVSSSNEGTVDTVINYNMNSTVMSCDPDSGETVIIAYDGDNKKGQGGSTIWGTSGTRSGFVITWGALTQFSNVIGIDANTYGGTALAPIENGKMIYIMGTQTSSPTLPYRGIYSIITVSGTSLTYGTPTSFTDQYDYGVTYMSLGVDFSKTQAVIVWQDEESGENDLRAITLLQSTQSGDGVASNLTSTNYFGVASNSATTTNPVQINVNGSINNAQTSLVIDKDYYVTDAGLIKERTTTTTTPDANPSFNFQEVTSNKSALSPTSTYEATSGAYVIAWKDLDTNYGYAVAGTISNGTMTWGTPVAFESSAIDDVTNICSGGGAIHITFRSGTQGLLIGGTISGTTITFYSSSKLFAFGDDYGAPMGYRCAYDTVNNYVIIFFSGSQVTTQTAYVIPMHYSASNSHASKYTAGTIATVKSSVQTLTQVSEIVYDSDTERCVVFYRDTTNSNYGYANVIQSTGSSSSPTVTVGSASQFTNGEQIVSYGNIGGVYDTQNDKVFIAWNNTDGSDPSWKGAIITVTGGGTNTISSTGWSDIWDYAGGGSTAGITFDSERNKIMFYYRDDGNSDYLTYKTITSGASSFTVANGSVIKQSDNQFQGNSPSFAPSKGVVLPTRDLGNSSKISSATTYFGSTTSTVVNGSVFAGTALSPTALELKTFPASTIVGNADGTVTKGKPVIVEPDGDFAQANQATTSFSQGTAGDITEAYRHGCITYDPDEDKYLYLYKGWSADYGKLCYRLGTPSGSGTSATITWGSQTELISGVYVEDTDQAIAACYDTTNNKTVVVYENANSAQLRSTVVTISGTTVTATSEVTIDTNNPSQIGVVYASNYNKVIAVWYYSSTYRASIGTIDSSGVISWTSPINSSVGTIGAGFSNTYDASQNAVVITYQDAGNSNYGTSVVGELNSAGSSISFGSEVVFYSNYARVYAYNLTTDTENNKIINCYRDNTNSGYGKCQVGTVTGNSISWGSAVQFNGTVAVGNPAVVYNANAGVKKSMVVFQQQTGSYYLGVADITVSGTTPTITSTTDLTTIGNSTNTADANQIILGSDNTKHAIVSFNSNREGDYIVVTPEQNISNLTAENYIGIAQETVSTNEDVKVTTISGVDANQSSLTPAQLYYVQTDGTLSTTAGSPSVVAGTAIAATQLLVSRS